MPDAAQVNRSLSTIRTELEYLRDAGILSQPQLQSIQAQLPVSARFLKPSLCFFSWLLIGLSQQANGQPSQYVDPGYKQPPAQFAPAVPQQIAQQAQDPNNPAHPQNPKVSSCIAKIWSLNKDAE